MQAWHIILIISGGFLFLGAVFLTIGLMRRSQGKHWSVTEGVIVKKGILLPSFPDRYPTVRYRVGETEYESTSSVYQTPGFRPGRRVIVRYNADRPEQAIIDSFAQNGTVFVVVGFILMGISLMIAFVALPVFWFETS